MNEPSQQLRYVVLRHEGIADPHFDLMLELETGGMLTTWRSAVWPLIHETHLLPLDKHRREYLTYEGDLSNNRGRVFRVESGALELVFEGAVMMIVRLIRPQQIEEWMIDKCRDYHVAMKATEDRQPRA